MPIINQWLDLHTVCLDTVREALRGIAPELLTTEMPAFDGSIGEDAAHLIGCEAYWLREVEIAPQFSRPPREAWSAEEFIRIFAAIEAQYREILTERGLEPNILFGLGRVCQHALAHRARIVRMRKLLEPGGGLHL